MKKIFYLCAIIMEQKQHISISAFDYPLPQEKIATHPLAERDQCKLLQISANGGLSEHIFAELPALLPANALLIYNNTRVINARLRFYKETGAAIEIFCLEPVLPADYAVNFASTGSCRWLCLVGNSKKWKEGPLSMLLEGATLTATRISQAGNAFVIEFAWDKAGMTFASVIEEAGQIPVPPYLNRDTEESDSTDYQTIYSRIAGSVAAPTAGLHFTEKVLADIDARGIGRRELTLHVGAGTFQPVKNDDVADHVMHSEFISVPLGLIEELAAIDRHIFAVGTTSVRTLESLYHIGRMMAEGTWTGEVPQWYPYSESHPALSRREALECVAAYLRREGLPALVASTRIMIAPPYQYKVVEGIVTNFHQPKSTLLLLVSAFVGDAWRAAYDYALSHDFRFLSYGDACLLTR